MTREGPWGGQKSFPCRIQEIWQYVGQGFRLHDVAQKIKVSMNEQLFSDLFADVAEEKAWRVMGTIPSQAVRFLQTKMQARFCGAGRATAGGKPASANKH